jgi:Protein of unknown function (DUF4239)
MMVDLVNSLANALPDAAILAVSAIVFGLFGGGIAFATNRWWFRRWTQHSPFEDKLADTAHTSLLGFSAFVLALLITNGVSSLSKTDDMVRQEATNIYRLNRELATLGPAANDARQTLAIYARNVADDEWPRLATLPNTLSPLVQKNLDDLWSQLRVVQRGMDSSSPARGELTRDLAQIENLRTSRLAAATTHIPKIFWIILLLFVAVTSFLSGRDAPKRFGLQVNMIHMAVIGLAVGLVVVLNNPFRGQTSIDPAIIRNASAS